jgi:hypothetical protein
MDEIFVTIDPQSDKATEGKISLDGILSSSKKSSTDRDAEVLPLRTTKEGFILHVIGKKETLQGIAVKYNVSVK